eukprot:TRINITY_DN10817_c0_g1_i2.p1 TRINITY_DN10817_c0_g1~~TRINITY_DN10817_c0_g1_i2.p1  ORF type:complete len:624 (+),score=64.21 TRINITY_DN10817_c0_g1_i2:366-2237(+)
MFCRSTSADLSPKSPQKFRSALKNLHSCSLSNKQSCTWNKQSLRSYIYKRATAVAIDSDAFRVSDGILGNQWWSVWMKNGLTRVLGVWSLLSLMLLGILKNVKVFMQPLLVFVASKMENFVYSQNKTDHNYFLSDEDNFYPVQNEVTASNLKVVGQIPQDLQGVYIRNGPNPQHKPKGKYYWFEGDGMAHSCRIDQGNIHYSNRFIQTKQYSIEKQMGESVLMKWGDAFTKFGLLSLIADTLRFVGGLPSRLGIGGEANTTLVYHQGRLYALQDQGCTPYLLSVEQKGQINTIEQMNIPKNWDVQGIECHCKVDPKTKQMYFMSQCYHKKPYLKIGEMAHDGSDSVRWFSVNLEQPIYMHDFAITENYIVVVDHPLPISMKKMIFGSGIPLSEVARKTRIGLISRKSGKISWCELDTPGFMMHVANAFETQDGNISVYSVVHRENPIKSIFNEESSIPSPSSFFGKYLINPNQKSAKFSFLLDSLCEFPTINLNYLGYQSRYTYLTWIDNAQERDSVRPIGILKYDMFEDKLIGKIRFNQYIDGQEPLFVPKQNGKNEDDGYLMMYVNDSSTQESRFVIYDAATMNQTAVAEVELPQRVPFGFHGVYLTDQEIQNVQQVSFSE